MLVQRGVKLFSLLYELRSFLRSLSNMYLNLSECDKQPYPNEKQTPQVIASKKAEFYLVIGEEDGEPVLKFVWSAPFEADEINGTVRSVSVSKQPDGKEEIARRVLNEPLEVPEDATLKPYYALAVAFDGVNIIVAERK